MSPSKVFPMSSSVQTWSAQPRGRSSKETEGISKMLEQKLIKQVPGMERHLQLPKEGLDFDQVEAELEQLRNMDHTRWEDGRVSGAVYHGGDELLNLQKQAIGKFSVANPIHPDVFPGVRKMEAEIVSMVLKLFNGPEDGVGVTTSGGTESILMACLAAREKAASERGVTSPEMIVPETGHAAFYKAARYFNIKLHKVSCPAPDYKVDIPSVQQLINENTVLLVGSAPNFPHGIVDDIPGLSRLAVDNGVNLHVDCCLGSFIMAFLKKSGFPSPYEDNGGFDFRQPGVTSISVDTHKYAFAPKGSSVLLYRNRSFRNYQYFLLPEWIGGAYASPSMAGSRPGSLIAGCWATLMSVGEAGYIDSCRQIVGATKEFERAILTEPVLSANLAVIGHPMASVIAFASRNPDVETYDIGNAMDARGWHLSTLQSPAAIHCAFTKPTAVAVHDLIHDLVEVVQNEIDKVTKAKQDGLPQEPKQGNISSLYGVGGSLPDHSAVSQFAEGFLDVLFRA